MDQPVKDTLLSYLDEVLSSEASKLTGKCMKRFEIIENREVLKRDIKELIYESFRECRDIFEAYKHGLEITKFVFLQKKE